MKNKEVEICAKGMA